MNRGQIRDEVSFLINFNDGQADQDFTASRLNKAIQYSYELEISRAKQEGMSHWFRKTQLMTWPAGTVTMQLPDTISQAELIGVYDLTAGNPGAKIQIRENSLDSCDAWWLDYQTLQWGNVGPPSTKTLQIHYMSRAESLLDDESIPLLMSPEFHWVLVWSAAIYLRKVADESAPAAWLSELDDWRKKYWKFLSRGRPMSDTPSITNSFVNNDVGLLY